MPTRLSLLLAVMALNAFTARAETISLRKPIDCTLGVNCLIQQYADHDPGPGAKDYLCGPAAYDGHDGTDFRLLDKVAQSTGVAVLAAAGGVVVSARDGQDDFEVGTFDHDKVKGVECGNGVLLDHGAGWQTQYCHMRRGSVSVQRGERVEAGQELGLVGQSGDAAFIHLHLTVRHAGRPVDPFAAGGGACGQGTVEVLWRQSDRPELAYRDTQVLNAGFAAKPIAMEDIERGGVAEPGRLSPALVFYARALSLRKGDVQYVSLTGPDGARISDNTLAPLERDKAEFEVFTGKKLSDGEWPAGIYRGTYTVIRGDAPIVTRTISLLMK